MGRIGHIYFHSPCFDGIVSSALVWDFLENHEDWSTASLHSVNYDARDSWLSTDLQSPSAVVDFLYHPLAGLWADHHETSFLDEGARSHFEARKSSWLMYNERSESCASLLWTRIESSFSYKNPHFDEMIYWADKIDSARYDSVDEAIFGDAPALRIRSSLAQKGAREYSEELVRSLRSKSIDKVSRLSIVNDRFEQTRAMTAAGLSRLKQSATLLSDGIIVFDVDASDVIINRYGPYHLFPDARYSIGLVRTPKGATITAMRNPWREFDSAPLGQLFEKLGGGGHQRVAAVFLPEPTADYSFLLDRIIEDVRIHAAEHKTALVK